MGNSPTDAVMLSAVRTFLCDEERCSVLLFLLVSKLSRDVRALPMMEMSYIFVFLLLVLFWDLFCEVWSLLCLICWETCLLLLLSLTLSDAWDAGHLRMRLDFACLWRAVALTTLLLLHWLGFAECGVHREDSLCHPEGDFMIVCLTTLGMVETFVPQWTQLGSVGWGYSLLGTGLCFSWVVWLVVAHMQRNPSVSKLDFDCGAGCCFGLVEVLFGFSLSLVVLGYALLRSFFVLARYGCVIGRSSVVWWLVPGVSVCAFTLGQPWLRCTVASVGAGGTKLRLGGDVSGQPGAVDERRLDFQLLICRVTFVVMLAFLSAFELTRLTLVWVGALFAARTLKLFVALGGQGK
eukprot:g74675.t1